MKQKSLSARMQTFCKSIDFSCEKYEKHKIYLDYSLEVCEIVKNSSQKVKHFDTL